MKRLACWLFKLVSVEEFYRMAAVWHKERDESEKKWLNLKVGYAELEAKLERTKLDLERVAAGNERLRRLIPDGDKALADLAEFGRK